MILVEVSSAYKFPYQVTNSTKKYYTVTGTILFWPVLLLLVIQVQPALEIQRLYIQYFFNFNAMKNEE
jgi:hypothetical protein